MLVEQKSDLDLCAYAVCSRNENRLFDVCNIKLEQTAETAYAVENALCDSPCDILFHQLYCLVSCCYVNSCVLVAV